MMTNPNLNSIQTFLVRKLVSVAESTGHTDFRFKQGDSTCEFWVAGNKEPVKVPADYQDIAQLAKVRAIQWDPCAPDHGWVLDRALEITSPVPSQAVNQVTFSNVNTGGGHLQAVAGNNNSQKIAVSGASTAELLAQLNALATELVSALKAALPPEQAAVAERDVWDVAAELQKEKPDLITVENKARSVWQRVGAVFTVAGDFAEKVGKIADTMAKYGPWLVVAGKTVAAACQ